MNKFSKITLGLTLLASVAVHAQNVGINTSNPDASAALDVQSTTQGLLIPRMTKTQRESINMVSGVSKPATGLMVYQTDNTPGFYFYNGTAWTTLSSGGQQLANGTAPGQIYLTGTTPPYAPQAPVTLSGDLAISSTGVATISNTNSSVYAAKKTTSLSLVTQTVFPTGFRAVNFVQAERTIGSAVLFSDTDNTYTIPSAGVYHIGYYFKYGTGLQASILPNSPGVGIVRTRAGVSTTIDSRPFSGANLLVLSLTISESSINSTYTFQAGDKISLGITGSTALTDQLLASSVAQFFIYKVSN